MSPVPQKGTNSQQAFAATIAGGLEILFFHPVDTSAKRLMSYQGKIATGGLSDTLSNVNQIVFNVVLPQAISFTQKDKCGK